MRDNSLYVGKAKIRTFKKRNQKASQKLFHKHHCLHEHTAIDDCDFILHERWGVYAFERVERFDNIDLIFLAIRLQWKNGILKY